MRGLRNERADTPLHPHLSSIVFKLPRDGGGSCYAVVGVKVPDDTSTLEVAPWEVASSAFTLRVGDLLTLDGKWYKCPTLTREDLEVVVDSIRVNLQICPNCRGLTRLWHKIKGHDEATR